MKPNATSKPSFSSEQLAAALAAAPERATADTDNPPTLPADWDNAINSRSLPDLREKLAIRRTRGPNKRPTKVQVAMRLSPEVLTYFRATGAGWQTRMDDALLEYVAQHSTE